ncbi:MAG: polysaccharide deacetylase family protein [Thermoleophilaceae bacterium]
MAKRLVAVSLLVASVGAALVVVHDSRRRHSPAPTTQVRQRQRHRHRRHGRRPALRPVPAQVRGSAARRMRVPILMYHVVGRRPPTAPYPQLWVTPPAFAAEVRALRRAGYWAITLRRAYDGWQRGAALPRRPIILSFDDGYSADYTHVRPVLRRMGWPGVLNLELDNVGPGGLTAHEIRALIASGWEVDSHTISHPDLTSVDAQRLRYELVASRRELRRRFGVRADFFCYPSGRYNSAVIAAVKAAGYRAATTTVEGYADPASLFALERMRVNDTDTAASVLQRLATVGGR